MKNFLLLIFICTVYISCGQSPEQVTCDKISEIIKENLKDPESFELRSCNIYHKKIFKDGLNDLLETLKIRLSATSKLMETSNESLQEVSDDDDFLLELYGDNVIAYKRMHDIYTEFEKQAKIIETDTQYKEFLEKEMVHIYENVYAANNSFGGKIQSKVYLVFKENEKGEFNVLVTQTKESISVSAVGNLFEKLPGIGDLLEKYKNYFPDVTYFNALSATETIEAMKKEGVYDTYAKSIEKSK